MIINVGIGECAVSGNAGDKIVTYALASCVAVTAYSPLRKVAGMVHIVLPAPSQGWQGELGPYYYAVSGIPMMVNKMCLEYGCLRSELRVRLFGGADSINTSDVFKLGNRNIRTVEKILKEMRISYDPSETSGILSRTLVMDVATGTVDIKLQPITI